MWIIVGLLILVVFASLWAMCRAAGQADNITEEWNKNWTGQKFKK